MWLHKLLNPHCEHCRDEKREDSVNQVIEILKEELASLRYNNQQLLKTIIEPKQPERIEVSKEEFKPVSNSLPWRVRQQMLEVEDRRKAQVIKEKKSIEELEKELGVEDASEKREAV